MVPQEKKRIHHELLVALYEARKRVSSLEAALAHHEALIGEGVEREDMIGQGGLAVEEPPENLLHHYIGLEEREDDISDLGVGKAGLA